MEIFKPEGGLTDEKRIDLIKGELKTLPQDLAEKNWTEIWNSLCHSELNSLNAALFKQLDEQTQEELKTLIISIDTAFTEAVTTDEIGKDKDLIPTIKEALAKIKGRIIE